MLVPSSSRTDRFPPTVTDRALLWIQIMKFINILYIDKYPEFGNSGSVGMVRVQPRLVPIWPYPSTCSCSRLASFHFDSRTLHRLKIVASSLTPFFLRFRPSRWLLSLRTPGGEHGDSRNSPKTRGLATLLPVQDCREHHLRWLSSGRIDLTQFGLAAAADVLPVTPSARMPEPRCWSNNRS